MSPLIQGGSFFRTYHTPRVSLPKPIAPATIGAFRLDAFEVTVGRFRRYVTAKEASGWRPAAGSGKHSHLHDGRGLVLLGTDSYEPGWLTADDGRLDETRANFRAHTPTERCDLTSSWTDVPGPNENRPVSCVSWHDAYAFCIWDGGFLPSDAEWVFAAAGGAELRDYPWGSARPGDANQFAIYGDGRTQCFFPTGKLDLCRPPSSIAPVGTAARGAGRWNQLDLFGNVWEWNLDEPGAVFEAAVNGRLVAPVLCDDCLARTSSNARASRGAGFMSDGGSLEPSLQASHAASEVAIDRGFRCARSP